MERGFGPGFDPRRLHHMLNTKSGSEAGFDPHADPHGIRLMVLRIQEIGCDGPARTVDVTVTGVRYLHADL